MTRYPETFHSPNDGTIVFEDLPLHWQMTRWEKFAFVGLLDHAKPDVAIEIGTYRGGSLQVIAPRARKVYSLDIEPECKEELSSRFENVEFHTGDSREILPKLLAEVDQRGERLGFVLVDGDHSAEGVRADLENLLTYRPRCDLFVLCHDSFNPECRSGMLAANWSGSPYVHQVEIDFVPGVFHKEAFDTAGARTMWAGLAVAWMRPQERRESLVIRQSQQGLFEQVLSGSSHLTPPEDQRMSLVSRLVQKIRKGRLLEI
jgi:hypothetical protein